MHTHGYDYYSLSATFMNVSHPVSVMYLHYQHLRHFIIKNVVPKFETNLRISYKVTDSLGSKLSP